MAEEHRESRQDDVVDRVLTVRTASQTGERVDGGKEVLEQGKKKVSSPCVHLRGV